MEKIIIKNHLSNCCKKPVYYSRTLTKSGIYCSFCNKEVFNTIDKKYYKKLTKKKKLI